MKKLLVLMVGVLLLGAACAGSSGSAKKTVRIGSMGTYPPFSVTDENGNLAGYDIEVLKLLNSKIPDLQFEYTQMTWDSLFLSLDTDKIDMVANQIARTPAREEKYLFNDDGYFYAVTLVVVHGDNNSQRNLSDFKGEVVGGIVGDYFTAILEEYNEANGFPFEIQYYPEQYNDIFMDIHLGRIAGTINEVAVVQSVADELGLNVKCVGDVVESSASYFAIRSDDFGREIKEKIDKAMKEVLADGSLAAISIKYFGEDYTRE